MKLKDKKTGEVADGYVMVGIQNNAKFPNPIERHTYITIAELNDEWEDYKPAEPLIKDEKIRKAVRAWAELHRVESVFYFAYTRLTDLAYLKSKDTGVVIDIVALPQLEDGEIYTIAELCGEEEE